MRREALGGATKLINHNIGEEDGGGSTISVGADRAALSVWDDGIGTVGCVLADHLVAHDGSTVADADLAGLWFPYILIVVQLSV